MDVVIVIIVAYLGLCGWVSDRLVLRAISLLVLGTTMLVLKGSVLRDSVCTPFNPLVP